jgi:hypothetical protein
MAIRENTFLLKRSNVPGKVPLPGDIQLGEVALNTSDVKLYASGTTENDIVQIGWDRINRTGDTVTGDFVFNGGITATTYNGDGSNLTGVYPSTNPSGFTSNVGTVTSVTANTSTTGTDITSSVTNSTTTPVITLNIPTASSTNRGALSSTDWITFNNKANKSITTTGVSVAFATPQIYNTRTSPATGNITGDYTNAIIGVVQKIYHNHSVAPTFPGTWVKLGSGTYTTSTLNIIYVEWVGTDIAEYWIVKGV